MINKIILFLTTLILLSTFAKAQNLDIELLRDINIERNTLLDKPMQLLSNSSAFIEIGFPLGIIGAGFIKKDLFLKIKGAETAASFLVSVGIVQILKYSIRRDRPFITYPEIQKLSDGGGFSFPSGHTAPAFALATSLSLNFKKWYVVVPSFVWASAVGYSRLHLGVHYPTDILASAIIGTGIGFITHHANKWIQNRIIRKKINQYLYDL